MVTRNQPPIDEHLVEVYVDYYLRRVQAAVYDDQPSSREKAKAATQICVFFAAQIFCEAHGLPREAIPHLGKGAFDRMIALAAERGWPTS